MSKSKKNLTILVALNLHEKPENVMERLDLISDKFKIHFYLIHVIEDMPRISFYSDAYALWEEFRDEAVKQSLSGMKNFLEQFKNKFEYVEPIVEVGSPVEKIIDKADELNADLIIVGSHNREGAFNHITHSNIAENIIRYCQKPVLTYHVAY